jgi:parvulin-like peptidyl-prolyl isomerase
VAVNSATDGGYSPSDAEVEEAIDQISGRAGGREGFDLSLAQFGMSIDDLKRQVSETMAITSWRDTAFLAEAKVSDEEARGFYEANIEQAKHEDQVRALQIMIPIPMIGGEQDDTAIRADAKARAEDLLKRAQDGEDFEELIQQGMDQATSAAIDNGRLGWVTKGMTGFPELEEVIFALKPGEVGGLVESPYSYHIVKVLETRPAGTFSFEEIKPEIVEILTNTKLDMKVREALMNLRRAAKVEILSPELAKAWPAFQDKLQAEMAASEAAAEAMDQAADSPAAGEPAPPASEAAPAAGEPTPAASEAAPAASEAAPAAGEPAAPAATEPAAPAATEPAPASSEAPAGQ